MNRFDPLNPSATPASATPRSAVSPAKKRGTRSAKRPSGSDLPAQSLGALAGKVTLNNASRASTSGLAATVRQIPLATFACLLGTSDEPAAVKARADFAAFVAAAKFTDWRIAWRTFTAQAAPLPTPIAPDRIIPLPTTPKAVAASFIDSL